MAVPVYQTFGGVLTDNTTYMLMENITLTTGFTLTPGSIGVGIVWDRNGFTVTTTTTLTPWLGLFPCPVDVWNMGVVSTGTTATGAGWFFQTGVGGTATYVYSTGPIGTGGGGVFGANSTGTATNSYSTGAIGASAGGIFGPSSSGTAINSFATGGVADSGGGIFGASSTGTAINSYVVGDLSANAGAIFGAASTGSAVASGYTPTWDPNAAKSFLSGTPDPATGVGSVWVTTLGSSAPFSINASSACFFGNAPVLTPSGYHRIDSLRVGDKVTTPTGYADVIKRIYKRSTPACPNDNPYIIPVGTYGAIEPLLISPRHCIAVNGKMVEACNSGLKQADKEGILTYFNLELASKSIMIVAGVEVESYVPR